MNTELNPELASAALWGIAQGVGTVLSLTILMWFCGTMNPLRILAIVSTRLMAFLYLLEIMWDAAWSRRDRWQECVTRANNECWIDKERNL